MVSRRSTSGEGQPARPRVHVRLEPDGGKPSAFVFAESFRMGRDVSCELQIDSHLVSRVHAEVVFDDGVWWVRDLGSTNGLYVGGKKVPRVRLEGTTRLQLGLNGPVLRLWLEAAGPWEPANAAPPAPASVAADRAVPSTRADGVYEAAAPVASPPDLSLSQAVRRYFADDEDHPAGERTMLIRRAYAAIKKQQQRKFTGIIAGVLVLLVLTLGLAVYQEIKNQRQEAFAEELFAEMKRQELATAQLRYSLLGDADPNEKLAAIEEGRRRVAGRFDAYVEELGLRRRLNPEEQLIHKTARIFHESEFSMPGPFVRAVRDEIRNYWLTPSGRARFSQAIQRAEQHGYTEVIVQAMQQYGLPPEFFYLALHESDFDKDARGPKTRWGIAKGMWQFIPSTGQEYGLQIGPREDERVPDPDDERHDVQKATDAAARYLLYIYSFDFDNPLLPYMEQASTEERWTPRLSGSPIATGRRANWF